MFIPEQDEAYIYPNISFNKLFAQFKDLKILVIGDLMIDAYYYGKVERISPEAPVPIVSVERRESRLGGAANVALNLKALGARVLLCGLRGNDSDGDLLEGILTEEALDTEGLITDYERVSTVKTRIIGNNHQVLRVDSEQTFPASDEVAEKLLDFIRRNIEDIDALIFEDYNKGVLSETVIEQTIALANKHNVPTIVDPKKENFMAYRGVTLFKPNRKEVTDGLKTELNLKNREALLKAAAELQQKLQCEQVLITLSEDGVLIYSEKQHHFIPCHPRKIIDVSGAGDTVVAVASLCIALNMPMKVTAELSNLAGGLVCENLGVVPIDADVLLNESLQLR